jgi:hypothetical protein
MIGGPDHCRSDHRVARYANHQNHVQPD